MIGSEKRAHDIFGALDQDRHSLKWNGNEPLLSRQFRLSRDVLAVYAVKKTDGKHILFLQCDLLDSRRVQQYPSWQGISVELSKFENYGIEGCYVRIEQGEGSDNEVFFAVADDLCICLSGVKRADLPQKLWFALDRWKRFFSLRANIKLTREEQLGAFGELWMLRNMLEQRVGLQCIDYWKGSCGGVFDFALNGMSLEVKTTASKMPYRIRVSNEAQLDERLAGGRLVLCFLAVQPSEAGGEKLSDIVDCIEEFAKQDASLYSLYQDKTFGCGLGKPFVEEYTTKYVVKDHGYYDVVDGFPRILHDCLPIGLGDISYSVGIAACEDFKIDEVAFWDIVRYHAREASA